MRKTLFTLSIVALTMGMFVACGGGEAQHTEPAATEETAPAAAPADTAAAAAAPADTAAAAPAPAGH